MTEERFNSDDNSDIRRKKDWWRKTGCNTLIMWLDRELRKEKTVASNFENLFDRKYS